MTGSSPSWQTSASAEQSFASHLRRVSQSTPSYFYVITGEPEHPFSLAHLCGMSDLELRSLLVSIKLAIIKSNNQFFIKDSAWEEFILRHNLHPSTDYGKYIIPEFWRACGEQHGPMRLPIAQTVAISREGVLAFSRAR